MCIKNNESSTYIILKLSSPNSSPLEIISVTTILIIFLTRKIVTEMSPNPLPRRVTSTTLSSHKKSQPLIIMHQLKNPFKDSNKTSSTITSVPQNYRPAITTTLIIKHNYLTQRSRAITQVSKFLIISTQKAINISGRLLTGDG